MYVKTKMQRTNYYSPKTVRCTLWVCVGESRNSTLHVKLPESFLVTRLSSRQPGKSGWVDALDLQWLCWWWTAALFLWCITLLLCLLLLFGWITWYRTVGRPYITLAELRTVESIIVLFLIVVARDSRILVGLWCDKSWSTFLYGYLWVNVLCFNPRWCRLYSFLTEFSCRASSALGRWSVW